MTRSRSKNYIGDGVYGEIVAGKLILTAEDGVAVRQRIVLDEEGWQALIAYVQAHARAVGHASEDAP